MSKRSGFTLIELLLAMAILVILSSAAISSLFGYQSKSDLDYSTKTIVDSLRLAQSRSVSGKDFKRWGVYFDDINGKFVIFAEKNEGQGYATAETKEESSLPASLKIDTISLNGEGKEIIFNRYQGDTGQYGTYNADNVAIIIKSDSSGNKNNIIVTPIGRIDSE